MVHDSRPECDQNDISALKAAGADHLVTGIKQRPSTFHTHKPGDPMPVEGDVPIFYWRRSDTTWQPSPFARFVQWGLTVNPEYQIIAWARADGGKPTTTPISALEKPPYDKLQDYSGTHKIGDLAKASPDDAMKWGLNPKEADGAKKINVALVPSPAIREIALAMMAGAKKPGRWFYNWRYNGLKTMRTTYLAGALRHIQADNDGEDLDEEMTALLGRPVTHLGAAMACLSIILDAAEHGNLVDDRPTSRKYPRPAPEGTQPPKPPAA